MSIHDSTLTSASCRRPTGPWMFPVKSTLSVPVCYLFSRLTIRKGLAQRLLYNMWSHFRKYPMFVHSHMLAFTMFYHVTRVYRGRYQRHRDDQGPVSAHKKSVLVRGKQMGKKVISAPWNTFVPSRLYSTPWLPLQ